MKNVYTVAQVNGYIKNMFTQDFLLQSILVKGEVSNCKYHSSGHIYFTLKDGKGAIACVMFAGNRSGLKFHMQEGQQVVVGGTIDVNGTADISCTQSRLRSTGQDSCMSVLSSSSGNWRSRGCLHRSINSRFLVLSGRSAL